MLRKDRTARLALTVLLLLSFTPFGRADNLPRAVVRRSAPIYPELARQMHVTGTVVLLVSIAPDGHVTEAKPESGHPLLIGAAQIAVLSWRFAPAAEASAAEIRVVFAPSSTQ